MSRRNTSPHKAFQVNQTVVRRLAKWKRRITRRLWSARRRTDTGWPDLPDGKVTYEVSDHVNAVAHGGLGAVHQLVTSLDLPRRIDPVWPGPGVRGRRARCPRLHADEGGPPRDGLLHPGRGHRGQPHPVEGHHHRGRAQRPRLSSRGRLEARGWLQCPRPAIVPRRSHHRTAARQQGDGLHRRLLRRRGRGPGRQARGSTAAGLPPGPHRSYRTALQGLARRPHRRPARHQPRPKGDAVLPEALGGPHPILDGPVRRARQQLE